MQYARVKITETETAATGYNKHVQVIVSDLIVNYTRKGKGKQLLILHGWGDNSASWQKFAAKLAKSYEVIVPDLPGFGATQVPSATWGLDEYAKFTADFI